jgi:phosphoribosylformylglycinamidine (FGAM) synthase-like enzyme
MTAYEMMLSESQERMLMVLKPERKSRPRIFRKWGLDFAIVGYTTPTLRFVVLHGAKVDGRSADQGTRRRSAGI